MKIAFFGLEEKDKRDFYQEKLKGHELFFYSECLTETITPQEKDLEIVSNFVNCDVNAQLINSLPNLKMITIRSTGYDNVDIKHAKAKNIVVSNVPAYGSHTVAEFTFGLILSLTRKISRAVFKVKYQNDFDLSGVRGTDLVEKTLGVIGTGKIGANVIRIAKGFGMNVLAYDPYEKEELKKDLGFEYVPLDELLTKSDIVTVHCPATPETNHIINQQNIFKMKKGALLINTARGKIVETQAIYQAITNGHLAGAGLDVLEEENEIKEESTLLASGNLPSSESTKLLQNHILMKLPQVIITPHMAFYTEEAENAIMQTTVDNILGFISGKPQNVVNG